MDEIGRMAPNEFVNMTEDQRPANGTAKESFIDTEDISKGQLEVRFRRYREHIAAVRLLVSKVSISVTRLEGENQSLREQSEYFRRQKNLLGGVPTKAKTLTGAGLAIEILLGTVERMHEKMAELEKIALTNKDTRDKTVKQNFQLKAILQKVQKDLNKEKKKYDRLQERVNFLENEFLKEAVQRLAAERRSKYLENQVNELSDELYSARHSQISERNSQQFSSDIEHHAQQWSSDIEHHAQQWSSDIEHNKQQLILSSDVGHFGQQSSTRSDTEHPLVANDANDVVTSTPQNSPPHRTSTATKYFSQVSWKKTAPKITSRFQNVFSDMEGRFRRLRNKIKTFAETKTTAFYSRGSLMEQTKSIFSWSLDQNSSSIYIPVPIN